MKSNSKKVVIVGAGFGGIYTAKKLHDLFRGSREVELTIINPENYFTFSPLLHEVATGGLGPHSIVEPIRKVVGDCLRTLILGKVTKVSLQRREVETTHGNIPYDYLVLAPGTETHIPEEVKNNSVYTLKSINDAIRIKNQIIRVIERASMKKGEDDSGMLNFVVVGGGPTGVELIAELEEFICETLAPYYSSEVKQAIRVMLLQRGDVLVPQLPPKFQKKSLEVLERKGIEVCLGVKIKSVSKEGIELESGEVVKTQTVIWTGGIRPIALNYEGEVEKDKSGRLIVEKTLQLKHYPEVFVIGDLAHIKDDKGVVLPSLAQVATKEAVMVAENIQRLMHGKQTKEFMYQHAGTLLSLGQWMAVGDIHSFTFYGKLCWWLWRTIYLFKLLSWQKQIKVAIEWTVNLFSRRDISEL